MDSTVEAWIARQPHWALVLMAVVAGLLFSGGVSFHQPLPLFGEGEWVAYAYKSRELSADMSEAFPPGSHASKLTTRLTFPAWVAVSKLNRDRLPAWFLFQSVLLVGLIYVAGLRFTRSRPRAFAGALLLVSSVVWSLSIWPSTGFSDGLAWVLCAATLLTSASWLWIALGVAALWTDERAVITLCCVALLHFWQTEGSARGRWWIWSWVAILGCYAVSRAGMMLSFNWQSDVGGIALDQLLPALRDNAAFLWFSFKVGGLLGVAVLIGQFPRKPLWCSVALAVVIFGVLASHLVHDVTRSMAYLFPLLLLPVLTSKGDLERNDSGPCGGIRTSLLLIVAALSLCLPSIEVIRSSQLHHRSFDGQVEMLIRDFC